MEKLGLLVNVIGLLISTASTLLLVMHVTNEYNSHIQDIGSIAIGYLGFIFFGVSVSVTGVALLLWAKAD